MREPRNLLLGQNVTPRHPRPSMKLWKLLLAGAAFLAASDYAFLRIGRLSTTAAPWPPAHLRLVPPIPQPQGTVDAYIPTQLDWLVRVVWEPVHAGRVLGAEPVKDADVCTVHVAAEASYPSQLAALQEGTAKCFTETFTRETGEVQCLPGEPGAACQARLGDDFEVIEDKDGIHGERK